LTGFQKLQELLQTYQSGGPFPTVQAPTIGNVPGDPVSAQFDQLQQMLDMLRSQGGRPPARGPVAVPPAAPAMNPQMAAAMMGMGMPPVQPPQGTIWVPGFGFVSLEVLMQALGGGGGGRPVGGLGPRGPFRGPLAAAAANGYEDPQQPPPFRGGPAYAAAQGNPQERTAAQAFRDSVSLIRTASDAARELQSLFPGQEAHEPVASVSIEDEDSPMRVIDAGGAKLVVNKKDGSLRTWETGFANMDKIFKWAGEQIELVRSREPQRSPGRQLPPGVVELHPGYQAPPGYAAVPLHPGTGEPQFDQAQLPPPPSDIPPPLGGFARPPAHRQAPVARPAPAAVPPPQPAPKRPWGPPPIPR
jgi:hypothetical protein